MKKDLIHLLQNLQKLAQNGSEQRVLIATHIAPDGDAFGSCLAFFSLAQRLGIKAHIYLPEGIPNQFSWLGVPFLVESNLEEAIKHKPQYLVCVDSANNSRGGKDLEELLQTKSLGGQDYSSLQVINIDHHKDNSLQGDHNVVEPETASTGQIIGSIAESLGFELTELLGLAVYLTLVADTGKFMFPNTSAETLAMASRIVGHGLNIAYFTQNFDNTWTLGQTKLWGDLLKKISLHNEGRVASCIVSSALFKKYDVEKHAVEGFAAQINRILGVELAVFIREEYPDCSKVSLRSTGLVDTQAIAAQFGGGGHKDASGIFMRIPPKKALKKLLTAIANNLA